MKQLLGTLCYRMLCWGLILLALVLLLLSVAFRGLLLFDDQIKNWASQTLGVPVEANVEATRWLSPHPQLFVSQLEVGKDESAIRVEEVVAEPNILQSLLTLSLSWQELRLSGVEMLIQEQAGGGWQIAGIDLAASDGSQATSLEKMLLGSRRISLTDINTRIEFYSGAEFGMQLESAEIENSLGFHRLVATAELDDAANQLELVVELTGIANRFVDLDGLAYTHFNGSDLGDVFSSLLDRYSDTSVVIDKKPGISGEVWANIHSGSRAEFQGYIEISDMPGQIFAEGLEDLHFQSDISGHLFYFEDELALDFIQPDFFAASEEWPLSDFRLTRRRGDVSALYSLQMQTLDLEELTKRATDLYALPEKLTTILTDLDLTGQVENLELNLDSGAPIETMAISADLNSVDVGYYLNAPAVRNLSGHVAATAFDGSLMIASESLSLHYPTLFDDWLDHGSVEAELGWQVDRDNDLVYISGKDISANAPDGLITAAFLVETGLKPREEGVNLDLVLGMQNVDGRNWSKYMPIRTSELLKNWLADADIDGQISNGSVVYRGKVKREYRDFRSIQLRLDVEQGSTRFLESWPKVTEMDSEIKVSNRLVNVQSDSANLAGVELQDVDIGVNASTTGLKLDLSLAGLGETKALIDVVRETDLGNSSGGSFDQLDVQGDAQFQLSLATPLRKELAIEEIDMDLSLELKNNHLALLDQNIQFDDLNGTLTYSENGLAAEDISVSLWNEPFTLSIREEKEIGSLNLFANGDVSIDSLTDWLNLPSTNGFSGKTEVEALLQVNTERESDKPNRYLFLTDMVGVQSTLPGDLSKRTDEETELRVVIESTDELDVHIEWSKGLTLGLRKPQNGTLPKGRYESAVLSFNRNTPSHQPGMFIGRVYQEKTDLDQWLAFMSSRTGNSVHSGASSEDEHAQQSQVESNEGQLLGLKPDLLLSARQLVYKEETYEELELGLTSDDIGWLCGFSNEVVDGDYTHPYEAGVVPALRLKELDVDALQGFLQETPYANVTSAFDPRIVPVTDVAIENLILNGESRGTWSAELRPSQQGLNIENIQCQYRTLDCGASGASSLYWAYSDEGQYSALSVDLNFEDVSDIFTLAGMEPPLTSEKGNFYASVNWNEAPHKLRSSPISGILGVELEDGKFQAQASGVGAGVVRLISLVNIRTWLRRLRLDFSDIASDGTPYDDFGGDFTINQNVVNTLTPVIVGLPSGRLLIDGAVDLEQNEVDAQLVVTLPARQNMAWIAALAGGLPAALGVWAVSKIFDDQLDNLSSVSYQVTGPLEDPEIRTDRVFDATVQEQ